MHEGLIHGSRQYLWSAPTINSALAGALPSFLDRPKRRSTRGSDVTTMFAYLFQDGGRIKSLRKTFQSLVMMVFGPKPQTAIILFYSKLF